MMRIAVLRQILKVLLNRVAGGGAVRRLV